MITGASISRLRGIQHGCAGQVALPAENAFWAGSVGAAVLQRPPAAAQPCSTRMACHCRRVFLDECTLLLLAAATICSQLVRESA